MKLLSPKSFLEYAAEEYQFYVMSLYRERKKKQTTKKVKSEKAKKEPKEKKISFRRTKSGKISVTSRRSPKFYTHRELTDASQLLGAPESELFILLKGKGFTLRRN